MAATETIAQGPTVGELIVRALKRHPERVAFSMDGREVTYRDTGAAIARLLGLFDELGLRRGDTLAQIARNSPEQWFVIAACYLHGLRSVTINAAITDIEDRVHLLRTSEARMVVCDPDLAEGMPPLRERCPQARIWFCHGAEAEGLPDLWARADAAPPAPLANRAGPEDIVRIGFTSGTTGRPKGVLLSSRALAACAQLNLMDDPWPRKVEVLCAEAVSGGFGNYVVPTLMSGGTFILTRSADAGAFLEAAERHRPTVFLCLPMLFRALLDHPRTRAVDWSRLELIVFSGASLTREEIARSQEIFGPALSQIYGQTECPKGIAILKRSDHLAEEVKAASVGTPVSGVRLAVLGEDLSACAPGEIGEICVRGPITMSGYVGQPELSRAKLHGGWLHTGDLAYADEEGFLFLVDRKEEVVRIDGRNIVPRLVEDALKAHPDVRAAAVIGLTGPDGGPRVKAYAVARPGSAVTADMLRAWLAVRGDVHVPDPVEFIDALPLTPIGRTDKGRLRRLSQEA